VTSDVDEVAVRRFLDGDRSVHLTGAEKIEAYLLLEERGTSHRTIARMLGVSDRTVVRWRSRLPWRPQRLRSQTPAGAQGEGAPAGAGR